MFNPVNRSQTQTEAKTSPPVIKLTLKKPDVNAIIVKMLDSELFSEQTILDIKECQESFNLASTNEDRLDILCSLLFYAVNPALSNVSEDDEEQLESLDDEIREQIAKLLPNETMVNDWIKNWNERELVVERLEQITDIFESRMQRLQQVANASNQQIANAFESLKQRIVTIIQQKQLNHQQVANEVNSLFENLHALIEKTNKVISSSNANSEKFQAVQHITRTICKEAIDKL